MKVYELGKTKHEGMLFNTTLNKPSLKRGKVGSHFLMSEKQKGVYLLLSGVFVPPFFSCFHYQCVCVCVHTNTCTHPHTRPKNQRSAEKLTQFLYHI